MIDKSKITKANILEKKGKIKEMFRKKEKESSELDKALNKTIEEVRAKMDYYNSILMSEDEGEKEDYDLSSIEESYNKCAKILTELYRIKEENKKDMDIEKKKVWIPIVVAIIGIIGTVLTGVMNSRSNWKILEVLLKFEETGTIKTFAGRKFRWFK